MPTQNDPFVVNTCYAQPPENPIPPHTLSVIGDLFNDLCNEIYRRNVVAGWWTDLDTGGGKIRNKGELLMLMVSEIAEAMEGERKDLMDDKLPHRRMAEVELADVIIRIADYAAAHGYDVGGAIIEKMEFNAHRADHKVENRQGEHGKKF